MRKLLAVLVLLTGNLFAQVIGTSTVFSTVDVVSQSHAKAYAVPMLQSQAITTYCWFLDQATTAKTVRFALYNGVSAPVNLVASSSATVGQLPGLVCAPLTFSASTVGWIYWESILGVDGSVAVRVSSTSGNSSVSSIASSNFPSTWSGSKSFTGQPTAYGSASAPPPSITVSIQPSSYPLNPCASNLLTATVSGTTNTAVTWSVNGTVTATSVADPTKSASVPITDCVVSASKVNLTWMNPTPTNGSVITAVKVYRSVGNGSFSNIATLAPGVSAFTDANVASGTSYNYQITEFATTSLPQESSPSNTFTAVIP